MTRSPAGIPDADLVRVECADGASWDRVRVARSYWRRLRGLMLTRPLGPGEGLLFPRCTSVHTLFMRYPIDVVLLDADLRVVGVETLPPWRLGRRIPGTAHILELPAASANVTRGQTPCYICNAGDRSGACCLVLADRNLSSSFRLAQSGGKLPDSMAK